MNILGKFGDVSPGEKEAILAILVSGTRYELAIHASKCLVALDGKQVQQFRSRIRQIRGAKHLHQNHGMITPDGIDRPADSLQLVKLYV